VVEMTPDDPALKIPQIGWNTLDLKREHPLFEGIPTGSRGLHAYFVHSYHLAAENADTLNHPASLTKMMTIYLTFEALKRGKITWDTPI
ncbi:hypothetical protein ACC771_18890, partial [Rhizobium ruizarguesonis]